MSPDNISSAVNRFSGWPSNDPLKTDKESMTSPMTVQVIKMIAAILDPHRIVVGIDTLYTTQRETFTSESQQLIESALQTLHVMNLNNRKQISMRKVTIWLLDITLTLLTE